MDYNRSKGFYKTKAFGKVFTWLLFKFPKFNFIAVTFLLSFFVFLT